MNILELAILKKMVGGGGGSGTDNYNDLSNLPQINGETLAGNKTAENLGLQDALFFDSAPTEDSTNPVESGGVYNALAGKQDNLTFDDVPTEDSTNPVKSGGVYSALAGKQDNLTFDGVYNASTNKAATESTVTNAIAGLGVSAFSLDAGETIKSISETDGKVSVVKQDIAIASSQVVAMTGYTKPSSAPATPAIQQGDTANAAIGKLEFKADTNQSNILYSINTGVKNIAFLQNGTYKSASGGSETTFVVENGVVTVTSTTADTRATIMNYVTLEAGTYIITNRQEDGYDVRLRYNNVDYNNTFTINSATTFEVRAYSYKLLTNATITPLLCVKSVYDQDSSYKPPALPNYDLTQLEAEDRGALAEVVDSGAKNVYQVPTTIDNDAGLTITTNQSTGTITISGTATKDRYIQISSNLSLYGTYIVQGCPSTGSLSTYYLHLEQSNAVGANDVGDKNYAGSTNTYNSASCKLYIRVVNGVAFGSGVTFTPMVCTKAAFGVSNKFVPFGNDPFYQVPINHNMIYRGRNLGASLTDAQHTALSSGNFTDLYLGDYWTKTVTIPAGTYTGGDGEEVTVPAQTNITLKAVIADFDTFYAGYASTYAGINTHHAAVIVTGFSNVVWNKTNSTAGGYVASLIHKWLVGSALPQIETWFGSAKVLSHQKLLTNAITGDAASGWAWSSQKISLLSENQMYGSKVWGGSKATNGGYEPGEAFKHLNVFNHIDANLLFGNKNIWHRDIASAGAAAHLYFSGNADRDGASYAWVAPAALILLS